MTRLPKTFIETSVALDVTLQEIDRVLGIIGVRSTRYMNEPPLDAERRGDLGRGRLTYQFSSPEDQRDVSIAVHYHPKDEGTTAQAAARALLWLMQTKIDAIEYGLESFEAAFMAHMPLNDNWTLAERTFVADVPLAELPAPEEDPNAPDSE